MDQVLLHQEQERLATSLSIQQTIICMDQKQVADGGRRLPLLVLKDLRAKQVRKVIRAIMVQMVQMVMMVMMVQMERMF